MRKQTFVGLLLALLILTAPAAAADLVLFDNFPINGNLIAWTIDYGYAVSDSFSLTLNATLDAVNFGVWLSPGDTVTEVDWWIGTTEFDNSLGSGTAAVTQSSPIPGLGWGYYDVDSASFSLPNINLAAGTYYLTLQNAVASNGDPAYWDVNDGPNIDAWESDIGDVSAPGVCAGSTEGQASGTCASSFQILGNPQGTPEPATWVLLGAGILAAGWLRRKTIHR